jgi:hypothetical protein
VTDEDRKKQAAVLAMISKLPDGASIDDYNRLRFGANIITPEPQKQKH